MIAELNGSSANARIMSARSLGEIRAGAGLNYSKGFNPILSDLGYANMSAEPSLVPLSRALKDADPRVRAEAVNALGKIKDVRAVKPLVDVLNRDPNSHIRALAADALGSIGRKIGSEYALRQALTDNNTEVSTSAEAALKAIGLNPYPEPLTGTYIRGKDVPDYGYEGYRLVVSNDGSLDAVYEISRPDEAPYLSVFVRSGDTYYIHGTLISPNDEVYNVSGDKWSYSKKNFTERINKTAVPIRPLIQYKRGRR
ncbi:MAG TPA: HEAT repeat domain-containing protein [Methanotrichaceae archaeon]|nr:HEAT repeat domain-containing protein [Methanotrichaceae archaeon]